MHTSLKEGLLPTILAARADQVLRKCVHCGFCNSACPTYKLGGNELDGPRGRIYLMKNVLEGETPEVTHLRHLDRCLSCQSCESSCPSGVEYKQLLEIAKPLVTARVKRDFPEIVRRAIAVRVFPYRRRMACILFLARCFRPLLPKQLGKKIPPRTSSRKSGFKAKRFPRKMVVIQGCVQGAAAPDINAHLALILEKFGIELVELKDSCCGALPYHIDSRQRAEKMLKATIGKLFKLLNEGVETIVSTASGCGSMIREYGQCFQDDPKWQEKARVVSQNCLDVSEVIAREDYEKLEVERVRAVFHSPCTLQHSLRLDGKTEKLLRALGVSVPTVKDGHICCGSAGYYSLFQPDIAGQLLKNKLDALLAEDPEVILTANFGCQLHLQSLSPTPVRHWTSVLH